MFSDGNECRREVSGTRRVLHEKRVESGPRVKGTVFMELRSCGCRRRRTHLRSVARSDISSKYVIPADEEQGTVSRRNVESKEDDQESIARVPAVPTDATTTAKIEKLHEYIHIEYSAWEFQVNRATKGGVGGCILLTPTVE